MPWLVVGSDGTEGLGAIAAIEKGEHMVDTVTSGVGPCLNIVPPVD